MLLFRPVFEKLYKKLFGQNKVRGPLQFTITWYKSRHAGEQTAHWEIQKKATLLNILLFWMFQWMACSPVFVPCDHKLQRRISWTIFYIYNSYEMYPLIYTKCLFYLGKVNYIHYLLLFQLPKISPLHFICFHNTLFNAKPTRGLMGNFNTGQPLLSSHPQGKASGCLMRDGHLIEDKQ